MTASTSADTIDVLLAGGGASFTAGSIRVYAILMDISDQGDMSADEVDRDTLAEIIYKGAGQLALLSL